MSKAGYKYDLFISYVREEPVFTWMNLYFSPTLMERLKGELPYKPEIFIDTESIQKGSKWSDKIQRALLKSKVLIAIWSAEYFRSEWCIAEWQSMEKRQKFINQKSNKPCITIFPIKFGDGEYFHEEARKTQMEDLSEWNYKAEFFRKSEKYMEFEKKIELISKNLSRMILEAPGWQSSWPVCSPESKEVKQIIAESKMQFDTNFKKPRM